MADDIKLVVGVDYSDLTGLIKTGEQTKRVLGSAAKEFAKTGNQKQYMHSINKIVLAQKQLDAASRMSRSEIMKLGAKMQQEVKFTDALTASTKRLTTVTKQASAAQQVVGKRANRAGVLAQQAGYQFGDFAVQVQSGTNIMVAFGQQATQLVGTFSMLAKSTKMISIFAGLGVIIPILTGIGAYLMRTAEAADTASDKAEAFENSLSSARSEVQGMEADLRLLASGFENTFVLTFSDAVEKAEKDLKTARENLSGFMSELEQEVKDSSVLVLGDSYEALSDAEKLLRLQQLLGDSIADRYAAAQEVFVLARRELVNAQELARQERQRTRDASVVNQLHEVRQRLQREAREEAEKYATLVRETQDDLADQIKIATLINVLGKDHADVARLRFEQEGRNKGLLDKELAIYVSQQMVLRAILLDTEAKAEALERSRSAAYSIGAVSFSNLADGATWAGSLADRLERARAASLTAAVGGNADFFDPRGTVFGSPLAGIIPKDRGVPRQNQLGYKPPSSRGGGGSDPFDQDAYLKSLQDEANFKNALVGLGKEEITELERRREIVQRIEGEGLVAEQAKIDSILKTEAATRSLIEAEEQRQATMDMISGHIESAFMAMVDGSKSVEDAFKGMIRAILLDVYQQAIAKPMANAITSFLFNKDGNAFSGGNVIPFANGGVVSSATMFPMAGNQTGVMGEAGPEAIMPLKRGANGKLGVQVQGGDGNTTVVQNFNFSANGDDSVKKIIAQAAPQIANMTKRSIMDDRRRGGQMKATFG